MTILEALKIVMRDNPNGMTNREAYEQIIERGLYDFPAKKPDSVVNGMIRRHCYGLDFPTANPVKYFKIVQYKGKKPLYALLDESKTEAVGKHVHDEGELPEEKIQSFYDEHLRNIYAQIRENIMDRSPSFFERLIVDLLLKMGYGYDKNSGVVVGGSHDNGIDGIISEDKLGLSLIYLQAKRYGENHKIGRQELQAFVGAMQNINKGVFITTSNFTKEATEYIERQQQKSIKLINGEILTELMVKYGAGVQVQQQIKLYKIDNTYFE